MPLDSAHTSGWKTGEIVFGMPFLAGVAVQFLIPFSRPPGPLRQILIPAGSVLIATGIGLIALARREFARYGQPTDPGRPTSKVVKTGVFAISRNPLYLGGALMFLGLALTFNMPWTLVTLSLSMVLCHYVLIVPEERYLAARFGQEYQLYTALVHRWLGCKQSTN